MTARERATVCVFAPSLVLTVTIESPPDGRDDEIHFHPGGQGFWIARTLRHLISTESWTHLNVFYNHLLTLTRRDIALPKLSQLCVMIKENCQLHAGIVEGTGYRDQVWYLHQIGTYLERADQTTRLLDINYHRLLPSIEDDGSQIAASRRNGLLRSVAGHHAFGDAAVCFADGRAERLERRDGVGGLLAVHAVHSDG